MKRALCVFAIAFAPQLLAQRDPRVTLTEFVYNSAPFPSAHASTIESAGAGGTTSTGGTSSSGVGGKSSSGGAGGRTSSGGAGGGGSASGGSGGSSSGGAGGSPSPCDASQCPTSPCNITKPFPCCHKDTNTCGCSWASAFYCS